MGQDGRAVAELLGPSLELVKDIAHRASGALA